MYCIWRISCCMCVKHSLSTTDVQFEIKIVCMCRIVEIKIFCVDSIILRPHSLWCITLYCDFIYGTTQVILGITTLPISPSTFIPTLFAIYHKILPYITSMPWSIAHILSWHMPSFEFCRPSYLFSWFIHINSKCIIWLYPVFFYHFSGRVKDECSMIWIVPIYIACNRRHYILNRRYLWMLRWKVHVSRGFSQVH